MTDVLADADETISAQDELFNAYFDDELSGDDRADFEARLDDDPEFAEAFDMFVEFMGGLKGIGVEHAPDDFVENFEETMRSRSRGKLFGQEAAMTQRFQIEIVAAIMLIVMATTYLFFGAPNDKHIGDMTVNGSKPSLEKKSDTKP